MRPVLGHFAAHVHHMGESGSGHTAKLINNFLNAISLAATAEAMVAGRKAGLDLRQLLEVINASSGVNFATLNRFPRIVEGDYLEGGLTGELMIKDVLLYVDLVRSLGATDVVDYRATDLTTLGRRYDVVIDTGGMTPLRRLRRILPQGTGILVCYWSDEDQAPAPQLVEGSE